MEVTDVRLNDASGDTFAGGNLSQPVLSISVLVQVV